MKTVLLTGATDGLGKALAAELDKKNYKLVLTGRNQIKMDNLISILNPDNIISTHCYDVLNEDDQIKFETYIKDLSFDILINNAGANLGKSLTINQNIQQHQDMMNLNCTIPLRLIQTVYPNMKKQQQGKIINILSSCCKYSNINMGAYTASKMALEAYTKILSKEAREDHINVCAIYPGGINTNFRANIRDDYLKPESVADAIIKCIELPSEVFIHELVLRPQVEINY